MTDPEITDDDLRRLVERVREAAEALMQGDVRRYFALVNEAPDYTLMPPTGGPTRRGPDSSPASVEALEEFFAGGGEADLELEQSYTSGDLVVLVGIERQHGTVGGLPEQDWSLRVTLVFRREGSDWRLVHRHADALVQPITMNQLSLLARGSVDPGKS
jgi:ketosteroid isomerase-like protein